MRFHYAFQQIVDLKSGEKTQAEWRLSEAVQRLSEEEKNLHRLFAEREGLLNLADAEVSRCTTASRLMQLQTYLQHIDREIAGRRENVRIAERDVTERRQGLSQKSLEEKVWLKARERAYHRHVSLLRKKEQDELDEMASVRRRHASTEASESGSRRNG